VQCVESQELRSVLNVSLANIVDLIVKKKDWETHKLNCVKVETKTEEINEKDENNKTPEKNTK